MRRRQMFAEQRKKTEKGFYKPEVKCVCGRAFRGKMAKANLGKHKKACKEYG